MHAESIGFPDGCFDTVVDTFGLCSMSDPIQATRSYLTHMKKKKEKNEIHFIESRLGS